MMEVKEDDVRLQALGVKAELVPVSWSELSTVVADGLIDVMPGVWYRPYWFAPLRLWRETTPNCSCTRKVRRRYYSLWQPGR